MSLNPGLFCVAANIAAGLWGYFYPYPYGLVMAVLICLPWLSLVALRFMGSHEEALAFSFLFPALALICRAINDVNSPTWGRSVLLGCVLSAVFVGVLLICNRRVWRKYSLLLVFTFIYGFGAVVESNMLLDSTVKQFRAPVISRDYSVGRHSQFKLVLGPWGNHSTPNKNFVSWNTYVALRKAGAVCIDQGTGAFGVSWNRILVCPAKN